MDINSLTQFSFYFGTAAMLCSAVFFFFERGEVAPKWRTSVTVAGLVTFIAFFHYYFFATPKAFGLKNIYLNLKFVPIFLIIFY